MVFIVVFVKMWQVSLQISLMDVPSYLARRKASACLVAAASVTGIPSNSTWGKNGIGREQARTSGFKAFSKLLISLAPQGCRHTRFPRDCNLATVSTVLGPRVDGAFLKVHLPQVKVIGIRAPCSPPLPAARWRRRPLPAA